MIKFSSRNNAAPSEHHRSPDLDSLFVRAQDIRPIEKMRSFSKDRIRVLFIGFSDSHGGAAIASSRLISRFVSDGYIAPLEVVALQKGDSPWTFSIERAYRIWKHFRKPIALRNMLASDPYGWLPFERAYLRQVLKAWQPQLIHLHNIHGGKGTIPLSMLPEMASFAPIIWTLHDMWLSTGHCAYSLKCERWREGCGSCPDLSLYPELLRDRTKQIAKNKRSILTQANPLLVTPSHWLGNIANDAFATKDLEIEVVANGVDLALFSPAGRDASRRALGIDPNTPVLMFAAQSLAGDIRKGARELRVALENLQARRDCRPLDIILMGESGESLFEGIPGLIIHRAGFISAPTEAAKFYAAADIFICPSLQDNLPNTLIEAAACGTAAITFDSGGCREVVEDGVSGFVLPLGDTDSLSKAISSLIEDPDRLERMGNAARTRAELLFSDTRMASGYYSLYQKLIKRRGG